MVPQTKERKIQRLLLPLLLLVCLCYLAVFAVINFVGFPQFGTPDMYVDTLVGKLMWEQKTLFPYAFVFGNQLYIVATPVLSALFYGLTGSPNTAMALATTVMTLLIILSFWWMLRPFLKGKLSFACALLMLLGCVFGDELVKQDEGQLFFVMCSYYACYLITLFFVLGDYARSLTEERSRLVPLSLALLLCFVTGMQSLRQTCIMVLPILAFEFLLCVLRYASQRRIRFGASSLRALAYAAFNLAGHFAVGFFDVRQQTIFDKPPEDFLQRVIDVVYACRDVLGFGWARGEYPFFILLFVFQMSILGLALWFQIKSLRNASGGLSCLWWLLLISLAAVIAAALFTTLKIRSIYLFTYYPLLALSMAVVMERLPVRRGWLLAVLLCIFSLGNLYHSYYDEFCQSFRESEDSAAQVAQWAVENGYELVYGNFSFAAPNVALYSDGALTAGSWNDEIMLKALGYLNLQNIYSEEDTKRAIYIFMPWEQEYAQEAAGSAGATLIRIDETVCGGKDIFTSDVQLMYPRTYPWFDKQWEMGQFGGKEAEETEEGTEQ